MECLAQTVIMTLSKKLLNKTGLQVTSVEKKEFKRVRGKGTLLLAVQELSNRITVTILIALDMWLSSFYKTK